MSLIVEDGTGLSTAESYISVTNADTYHTDRGNAAWALLSTQAKEQALRKAAEYMVGAYRDRWAGYRMKATQALDWPRYEVPIKDAPSGYGSMPAYYDWQSVPTIVARTCAELALKASAGPLTPDLTQKLKSVKAGSVAVEFDPNSSAVVQFRQIDLMLEPFLVNPSGIRVFRA